VGGCMIAADKNYTRTAEVHVPQFCATPADYHKGCMFPGATNFDPNARQSADCHYLTHGCTDSTAVNFNAEASIDDGSCIVSVHGCTVHSTGYFEVQSTTPSYQDRFVGVPLRAIGKVDQDSYGSVLNYAPTANVLDDSCIITIEGCMDSLAINYDPHANVNSRTWCVMPVTGCMMPATSYPSLDYSGSGAKTHTHDGLAINFEFGATVSDPDSCIIERFGCTDSLSSNYDSHATVAYNCYPATAACFDNLADNFNCTKEGEDVDGVYQPFTSVCTTASPRGTFHADNICVYSASNGNAPTPPPPPDGKQGGKVEAIFVETTIPASGSIEEFVPDTLAAAYETSTGLTGTTASVTGGSVNIVFVTQVADEDAYNAASATVSSTFPSLASINSALGVDALGLPVVVARITYGDKDNTAVIVGGAVGGTVGGLCMIAIIVFMVRKSKKVEA